MTKQEIRKIAIAYVDKQIASMKKNGLKTKPVSKDEHERLVERIAAAIRA
jgi:hypothetical protein